jgi:hypothetical protein
MATPEAQGFHAGFAELERQKVLQRIAMGTRKDSPQIMSMRRANALSIPTWEKPAGGPRGAMPFGINHNDNVASLSGGLQNREYANFITKRFADQMATARATKSGLPAPAPVAQQLLTLSESDSLMIELNALFQSIEDAIETENVSNLTINELKNIPRILIRSVPSLDQEKIGIMIRYVMNLLEMLEPTNLSDLSANEQKVKNFLKNVLDFLEESMKYVNLSPQQRNIVGLEIATRFFSLTARSIKDIKKEIEEIPVEEPTEPPVEQTKEEKTAAQDVIKKEYEEAKKQTKNTSRKEIRNSGFNRIAKLIENAGVPKEQLDKILSKSKKSQALDLLIAKYYPYLLE